MSKKNQPPEGTVRMRKESVQKAAKIARYIRILLYLGIAFMLFSRARAADPTSSDFKVRVLKIGSQTLKVEVADDDKKRSQGLMHRKELKEGLGMLFIFPQEQKLSFWMKNTLIPLSIGYFDKNRKLIETIDMIPASPMDTFPPSYPSSRPAQYALEVPKGWFVKHKIKPGTSFKLVDKKASSKTRH